MLESTLVYLVIPKLLMAADNNFIALGLILKFQRNGESRGKCNLFLRNFFFLWYWGC
jgi:hypothetical protein